MKNIKRHITVIMFMAISMVSFSQVLIDKNIIMADSTNSKRIITSIGSPVDSLDLININEAQKSTLIYGLTSGINNLVVNTPVPFNKYSEGMTVSFKAQNNNTDSVSININNLGFVPIKKPEGLK